MGGNYHWIIFKRANFVFFRLTNSAKLETKSLTTYKVSILKNFRRAVSRVALIVVVVVIIIIIAGAGILRVVYQINDHIYDRNLVNNYHFKFSRCFDHFYNCVISIKHIDSYAERAGSAGLWKHRPGSWK